MQFRVFLKGGAEMVATDKIGTVMTWEELLNEFPEMYVGLGDYADDNDGIRGRVLYVCNDVKERDRILKQNIENSEQIHWLYTYDEMRGVELWQL